jgi:outer membrane protein assembly factor BamB
MRTRTMTALAAATLALSGVVHGGDWPQWRGPKRDGHADEKGLLKAWPKEGPKLLWTYGDAGTGYTAPAVVGGKVYTMGCRKDDEFVICLDDKGKELWATKIGPVFDWNANSFSRGPNSTPSVDGDLVFALGSGGILVCVDTAGKVKWRKDLPKEMAGEVNPVGGGIPNFGWGYCWSPLVDGDRLIITPGGPKGLVAALNKTTGGEVWRSTKIPDQATYSSPIVADVAGVRQYIVLVQDGAVGIAAKDGTELWRFKRENPFSDIACPTPVYHDGRVFITARGGPSHLLELKKDGDKFKATDTPDYVDKDLVNDNGGVYLVGDYLYGAHAAQGWRCIHFKSGKKTWTGRVPLTIGPGVYADGMLVCFTQDKGEVVLIEANPEKYTEKGRFKLPKESTQRKANGKFWTHPVIADGKLYLRDQELIFCYEIK